MKENGEKRKKLNKIQLIEALAASILTVAIFGVAAVYAWFMFSNRMETMTRVKQPDNLDIRAGDYLPIINFELSGINIKKMAEEGKPEYRVFSVSAGDYKISYLLQLAYTTNIPFKYTLYSAEWKKNVTSQNAEGTYVEFHPLNDDTMISYYEIKEVVNLMALNADEANEDVYGRVLGKKTGTIYEKTYDDANDDPEIYAVPIYKQSALIRPSMEEGSEHDFYVLKIEWDSEAASKGFKNWNKAENNKETDIICITASRGTY